MGKRLAQRWSQYLATQPETGMGYHVVAVTLNDGRRIEDVAIIDSAVVGEVRGVDAVPFDADDISGIEVTHRKWSFRNG